MCDSKNPGTNRKRKQRPMKAIRRSEWQAVVVHLAVMGSCYGMSYQRALTEDG